MDIKEKIENFCLAAGYKFLIGIEIEFYLDNFNENRFANFRALMDTVIIEKERGKNQFEVKIQHSFNIENVIDNVNNLRDEIIRKSEKSEMKALFCAKPFTDQPGSAMHVNVSIDHNGSNIFAKLDGGTESPFLLNAIGGLCRRMKEDMIYFVPNKKGYERFVPKENVPTTISWGANNRTVAVRVPTTDNLSRRIEHRVSSADANPGEVIFAVLDAIIFGIENKIIPPEKIYGDASDGIYNMEKIPTSFEEALSFRKI